MIALVKKYSLFLFIQTRKRYSLIIFLVFFGCGGPKNYIDITGPAMGTSYTVRLVPQRGVTIEPSRAKTQIDSVLEQINNQMSTYVNNSEISLFNKASTNSAIIISSQFKHVINRSIYWSELSNGAFDISSHPLTLLWRKGKVDREYEKIWEPPTDLQITLTKKNVGYKNIKLVQNSLIKPYKGQQLDVNAIAKGWGVDMLFNLIKSFGYQNFMVEIGGEIRVSGKNNRGQAWNIGIDIPEPNLKPGEKIFAIVPVTNKAMATSGNYRNFYEFNSSKYSHIIDPRSGYAIDSNISSVTVISEKCIDADALATALNVMSLELGMKLVESVDEAEAFWIINEGGKFQSFQSSGMKVNIQ